MKKIIAKLTVITIITLTSIFIMSTIVMAYPGGIRSIRGTYAATGSGMCLVAASGFDDSLIPNNGVFELIAYTIEAVFTFKNDGTGHIARATGSIFVAGTEFPFPQPAATNAEDSWDFTYEVEPGGSIRLTQVPDTYAGEFKSGPPKGFKYQMEGRNLRGSVSPDGKTITLNGGSPEIITQPGNENWRAICNESNVLTWLSNR